MLSVEPVKYMLGMLLTWLIKCDNFEGWGICEEAPWFCVKTTFAAIQFTVWYLWTNSASNYTARNKYKLTPLSVVEVVSDAVENWIFHALSFSPLCKQGEKNKGGQEQCSTKEICGHQDTFDMNI